MIDWTTEILGNTVRLYAIFIGLLAAGVLAGKILSWLIRNIIRGFAKKTTTKIDDVLVDVCDGPLVFAVFVFSIWMGGHLLEFSPLGTKIFAAMLRILVTATLAWFLIRFLDSLIEHYLLPYASKSESDLDDVLLPILRTAVKIIVICVAGIMILSDFGFNVMGLVAGLGIGGLALAFAAKDLIANVFGGVSVIADKPFKLGDMVKFDGRQGVVREIGIRTTRIETLDGTQLIVPNAKFTDGVIENVTNRKQHRVSITLGLEYGTSAKRLKKAREILSQTIKKHKGTTQEPTVYLQNFGNSSLDVQLIYYVKDLANIPGIQDEVNSRIKEEFEKAGIGFAYPTTTVIMKK